MQGKGRFSRNLRKNPSATCNGAIQRLAVWMMFGTAFFFYHFAFFGAESLNVSVLPLEKTDPTSRRGFFSGVHYREFGLNDIATVPPKKSIFIYVYEQNANTGSNVWSQMMRTAEMRTQGTGPVGVPSLQRFECNGSRLENSISLAVEEFNKSVFTICSIRRMSVPRNVIIHPISSFNLDRDILTAAYMEEKNLPLEKVDKSGESWKEFKAGYSAFSSLDFMGYSSSQDAELTSEACPLSNDTQGIVNGAVADTFLPISMDLPCISKKLLSFHLKLEIDEPITANAHSGKRGEGIDSDKGCVEDALVYGLTAKMLKMYDGTKLSQADDWRELARRMERDCSGITLQATL